jgi:hypothetical protein
MIQNEDLASIPLLILVNKLDAPDNIPLAEMRQQFSIMPSLVGDRPARITPISAMTGCASISVVHFFSFFIAVALCKNDFCATHDNICL